MKPPTGPPPGGYGYLAPATETPSAGAARAPVRRGRRWLAIAIVLGMGGAPVLLAALAAEDRVPPPPIATVSQTAAAAAHQPDRELDVLATRDEMLYVARATDRWIYAQPIGGGRRKLL